MAVKNSSTTNNIIIMNEHLLDIKMFRVCTSLVYCLNYMYNLKIIFMHNILLMSIKLRVMGPIMYSKMTPRIWGKFPGFKPQFGAKAKFNHLMTKLRLRNEEIQCKAKLN